MIEGIMVLFGALICIGIGTICQRLTLIVSAQRAQAQWLENIDITLRNIAPHLK